MVDTIHGEFASRGDTMAAKRKHAREAEVATVKMSNPKCLDKPNIMLTKHDAEGLHFSHDDALIVKFTIARSFVKIILIDIESSVDISFLFILKLMKFEEEKIGRITMNLAGFNGEPSAVIEKLLMSISTGFYFVYSTMMVVDTDSTYNAIFGSLWLNEMSAFIPFLH